MAAAVALDRDRRITKSTFDFKAFCTFVSVSVALSTASRNKHAKGRQETQQLCVYSLSGVVWSILKVPGIAQRHLVTPYICKSSVGIRLHSFALGDCSYLVTSFAFARVLRESVY